CHRVRHYGGACACHRDHRLDAGPQTCRGGKPQLRGRHLCMDRTKLAQVHATTRTSCDMGFHLPRKPGIELVIKEGASENFRFLAGHDSYPSASHAVRRMERARARRDMTVPTGAPITSAMSRYDRSLISRSTITSRNGSGSAATRRWMVPASSLRIIVVSGDSGASPHNGSV